MVSEFNKADMYYQNKNDILRDKSPTNLSNFKQGIDPFRNADNRISHNWFNLLVNQKAGYMFTYPPVFDVGDSDANKRIKLMLSDDFGKICKNLCIDASKYGVSWLHIWKDDRFKMAVVNASQIIPIYSESIFCELSAVIRAYEMESFGKSVFVYEYWTEDFMYRFKNDGGIVPFYIDGQYFIQHNMGIIPFIEFRNNNICQSDLESVKSLIDVYDKVYSGFVNDIEDIQQVILILTNFGGENLQSFLADLKRYKAVDLQVDENDSKSGMSTMSIDIPTEARREILDLTRRQIFISGQGVYPDYEKFGAVSGVALKHLYGLLELKCGLLETEFRSGFGKLIRFLLNDYYKDFSVEQTYTRAFIENDVETAEILEKIAGFTSVETLAKNNPYVDDFETEIINLKGKNNER